MPHDRRHAPGPDRRRFPRGGRRAGDASGHHPTIAIVEPYEGVRRPCARYLDHFRFDVAEAADAAEGLSILEHRSPALILVDDTELPAVTTLLEQARARTIPFVRLTTAISDESSQHSQSVGAAGILVKPFSLSDMVQEIRRVLRAQMAV